MRAEQQEGIKRILPAPDKTNVMEETMTDVELQKIQNLWAAIYLWLETNFIRAAKVFVLSFTNCNRRYDNGLY